MPHMDQVQNPLVSSVFHRKRVFCSYRHAAYLAEALIKVFVDIEFTGKGVVGERDLALAVPLSSSSSSLSCCHFHSCLTEPSSQLHALHL